MNNKSILIRSDNSNTVSYINNQGGRSQIINDIIFELYDFCISRNFRIEASFLAGKKNVRADALSRQPGEHSLSLKPNYFNLICRRFNIYPSVDLFASRINHKIPYFFSEGPDPLSSGINAFSLPWPDIIYAFPPFKLISKFILHFINKKIPLGILITPYWPAQSYFPLLLDIIIENPIIFSDTQLESIHSHKRPWRKSRYLGWLISSIPDRRQDFLRKLRFVSSRALKSVPSVHTSDHGKSLPIGSIAGISLTAKFL